MSKIVVIDDRVTNRNILTRLGMSLEPGVVVHAFENPEAALDWMAQRTPELVVTDYKMPTMDGAEFIRRCRRQLQNSDVPIIVITAYDDRDFRYRALEAGATDFLLSPIDHHEFRCRGRNLLQMRRQQLLLKQRRASLELELEDALRRHAETVRQSEERLRLVMNTVPALISASQADGSCMFLNDYHEQVFDIDWQSAAGKTKSELFGREYGRKHEIFDRQVFATGETLTGIEESLTDRDGGGRVFLTTKAPLCGKHGRVEYVVTVSLDITERKQIELELLAAKNAAERANRAKSKFLAAASHDLRQPLQALNLFVAVLASRVQDVPARDILEKIKNSLQAVNELLDALLDISKLDAGMVVPEIHDFPAATLLDRLVGECGPLAMAKGLRLRTIRTTASLRSDPVLLERILRNLLGNALQYTDRGGILLGCRRRGACLRIEVWDTGIGIPNDQLPLIFQEFHQVGNQARNRREGLGLGLAIVDRMAQLLGLRVAVASTVGKGSVFAVKVPLGSTQQEHTPPALPDLVLADGVGSALIVAIDDDNDIRDGMMQLLDDWGCNVLAASSGADAITQLLVAGRQPDLVIADYRLLNGELGTDAIRAVRNAVRNDIPGILLTGDTAPERLREAKASGFALLHKPIQPARLRAAVATMLAGGKSS